jgi:hypothetical protein
MCPRFQNLSLRLTFYQRCGGSGFNFSERYIPNHRAEGQVLIKRVSQALGTNR